MIFDAKNKVLRSFQILMSSRVTLITSMGTARRLDEESSTSVFGTIHGERDLPRSHLGFGLGVGGVDIL